MKGVAATTIASEKLRFRIYILIRVGPSPQEYGPQEGMLDM